MSFFINIQKTIIKPFALYYYNSIKAVIDLYILQYIMPKKETIAQKSALKVKKLSKDDKEFIKKRGKEFLEWKKKNLTQKWFFSLEEREQKLVETSYMAIMQLCPDLTREDYLNRVRLSDTCNKTTKAVKKSTMKFLHLD